MQPGSRHHIPWDLYQEFIRFMPIACVDVVIMREGRALLIRRQDEPAKGQMWLPGGRVLKGELLRDAAVRKARSETGIACRVGPVIHTAETIFEDGPGGIPVHSINHCFLMHMLEPGAPDPQDVPTEGWRWIDEIDRAFHPYVQACLTGAGLGEQSRSIQTGNAPRAEPETSPGHYRIDYGGGVE